MKKSFIILVLFRLLRIPTFLPDENLFTALYSTEMWRRAAATKNKKKKK